MINTDYLASEANDATENDYQGTGVCHEEFEAVMEEMAFWARQDTVGIGNE